MRILSCDFPDWPLLYLTIQPRLFPISSEFSEHQVVQVVDFPSLR